MTAEERLPLFVYGTLRDPATMGAVTGDVVADRAPARARGRRHPVRAPYPAVSFRSAAEDITGELLWIAAPAFPKAIRDLDSYEGAPHLFRRVRIVAELDGGRQIEAYAYEWAGDLGPQA